MPDRPDREATRQAHHWVAGILHGALGNGSGDDTLEDPAVMAAVHAILARHEEAARPKFRLSKAQAELLTDLATNPQMYIRRYSRWDRTACILIEHGLARRTPGYAGDSHYEVTITDFGRTEAIRRGLVTEARHG